MLQWTGEEYLISLESREWYVDLLEEDQVF
jgi:hypothetical protein